MFLFNRVLIRGFHSDIYYYTSSPLPSSADLLKVLVIACDVAREDVSEFVHQLAEGRDGLSLVYMYHADALKSGTSYQNSSHIHLRDNCEVGPLHGVFSRKNCQRRELIKLRGVLRLSLRAYVAIFVCCRFVWPDHSPSRRVGQATFKGGKLLPPPAPDYV